MPTFSRKLGDSELSYFLPSRADGVNDMYLHLGFRAPQSLVNPHRVAVAWAILRMRHPLLAASVLMEPGEYDTARFVYTSPTSAAAAIVEAKTTLILKNSSKAVLIDAYLNGPRTLSNERVSVLILSSSQEVDVSGDDTGITTPPRTPRSTTTEFGTRVDRLCEFDLLFCAAHFLGDGIALHNCVNDLFTLLASPSNTSSGSSGTGNSANICAESSISGDMTPLSDTALYTLLELQWSKRWARGDSLSSPAAAPPGVESISPLPPPLESRLPGASASSSPLSKFQRVAHDLAFHRAQGRLIGGHAFARPPRPSPPLSESDPAPSTFAAQVLPAASKSTNVPRRQCHTLVRTVAFPPALTRRVLKRCKEEGVSVAHVMFALCNVAWGRVGSRENGAGRELPMMMYSALNLRPYLTPPPAPSLSLRPGDASYWFLAVGFFNVVLPAFLLSHNEYGDSTSETSVRKTLFHRARLSKRQCVSAAKTPLLAAYAQRMARERGERAKGFARADDGLDGMNKDTSGGQAAGRLPKTSDCPAPTRRPETAQALPSPPSTPTGTRASTPSPTTMNDTPAFPTKIPKSLPEILPPTNKASATPSPTSKNPAPSGRPNSTLPSTALLGLSLLGNLDAMYTHGAYAPLTLHTLTTGSRQRAGALLLFGYTFGGKLWVSLGWDGGVFGGEGEEGVQGEARGVVWEGLGADVMGEGVLGDSGGSRQGHGDRCGSERGVGVERCEGELGRWWREVVKGVGEFFGEENA